MKGSMLQTGVVGLCILQGFLGFVAIGYADTTLIVSKSGPYFTISDAVKKAVEILKTTPQMTPQTLILPQFWPHIGHFLTEKRAFRDLNFTDSHIISCPIFELRDVFRQRHRTAISVFINFLDFYRLNSYIFI